MTPLTDAEKAAINRRMSYLSETTARLAEIRSRARGAKHFVHYSRPAEARQELERLISEAKKLDLHLSAWGEYLC